MNKYVLGFSRLMPSYANLTLYVYPNKMYAVTYMFIRSLTSTKFEFNLMEKWKEWDFLPAVPSPTSKTLNS